MMLYKKFLCIVLVFSVAYLGMPLPLEAGNRAQIAVLELHHESASLDSTEEVADSIRDGLKKEEGYWVISKKQTEAVIEKAGLEPAGSLASAIKEAMQDYRMLELERAEKVLKQTLNKLNQGGMRPDDVSHLVDAYLLLGELAMANGKITEVQENFREVVRLSPETTLDEKRYSPKIREIYSKVHDDLMRDENKLGTIEVAGEKKVDVSLNGILKGRSPLTIQGVPAGKHYITFSKKGYGDLLSTLIVSPTQTVTIEASLATSSLHEAFAGIEVVNPGDKDEVLAKALQAGRALNADRVVLVYVKDYETAHRADVQSVDVNKGNYEFSKDVTFGKGTREREGAVVALLDSLPTVTPTAEFEPFSPPIPVEETGKKPIWKSPVFWIITGVVLAGVGTGVGLGLGSGGSSEVPVTVSGGVPALQ